MPGKDELQGHFDALGKLTGEDQMMLAGMARNMFKDAGPAFEKLSEAMSKHKGYPVKVVTTIESAMAGAMPGGGGDDENMDPKAAAMMKKMQAMMGGKASEDGMTQVMSMTTVVTAIETGAVDETVFELPKGITKQ